MKVGFKVAGRYEKFEVLRPDGTVRVSLKPFDNLITDWGLDAWAGGVSGDFLGTFKWGSGNATPAVTDTTLQNELGQMTMTSGISRGTNSAAPYGAWFERTFTTPAFTAPAIIAELGIGNTTHCLSRTLVKDEFGNPTTVAIAEGEQIRATYRIYYYASSADTTGTFTATVAGVPTVFNTTTRAAQVTSGTVALGWFIHRAIDSGDTGLLWLYNGAIGPITGTPTGTSASFSYSGASGSLDPYVPGTFKRGLHLRLGPTQGNLAGGITVIRVRAGCGNFQIGFSPAIPKDGTTSLRFGINVVWSRA